ncbi:LysR substrate-binding domain-containing protein [Dankookia sp. P2]|uniref:LysR substrate-binding domain-containing protein n=1 Tax=Dankookia sp. P2 TaxID=3423955 RepID=UPI003D67D63B
MAPPAWVPVPVRSLGPGGPEPACLARRGRPAAPEDLLARDCPVLRCRGRLTVWPFRTATGLQPLAVHGIAATGSAEALRDLRLARLGILRVRASVVARGIAEGRMVPLAEAERALRESSSRGGDDAGGAPAATTLEAHRLRRRRQRTARCPSTCENHRLRNKKLQ